jgi:hypothetical protein
VAGCAGGAGYPEGVGFASGAFPGRHQGPKDDGHVR